MEQHMQGNTSYPMDPNEQARLKLPMASNAAEFLIKLAIQRGMPEPVFTEVSDTGPPHMKKFVWHCTFNDLVSQGIGPSKKEAKLAAAKAIKDALDYENLPPIKPVRPVHGEMPRKRKNESNQGDVAQNNFGKKGRSMEQDISGQGLGVAGLGTSFDSQMQGMPSLMNSYGMGFGNVGSGFRGQGQMGFQSPAYTNGMGFGNNRPQGFGSFQPMQSVNHMPIGLENVPSLSRMNRMQQGLSDLQGMSYPNPLPMGPLGFGGLGMLGSMGFGRQSAMMGLNNLDGPLPLMGFNMNQGLNRQTGLINAAIQKQATSITLERAAPNPYNPYTVNLQERKKPTEDTNDTLSSKNGKPTKEAFMHPSFGNFYSDAAAGPSLKDFPEIERDRKYMIEEFETRMIMNAKVPQNQLDKTVLSKHKELCPKENELKFILKLVTDTERSLKKVAADLNKLENEPLKAIDGMLRVGDLSKGLLMVGDRAVNLLLMCKNMPSLSLLRHIQMLIVDKLKEVSPNNEYQIHGFEEEAGFCVVAMPPDSSSKSKEAVEQDVQEEDLPFAVNVSLTTMSLSNNTLDDTQNINQTKVEDPLPKEKCILALSEMRHSKWFSVTSSNMSACTECIRIVKDISNRDPIWNAVPDWGIEVMVERAAFTAWVPLNIGALLKRVMEMLACGILLPNGSGIKDPCESNDVDVMADLSSQQKENLTKSAQRFLRLLQFNKAYEILGIDAPNEAEVSVHEATITDKEK